MKTVRDFTQIFDAYAKFMERLTSLKMDELKDAKSIEVEEKELELELFMTRFEHLMDRRPLLLNSVLLRQNPHNAHEWLNRVQLNEGFKDQVSTLYSLPTTRSTPLANRNVQNCGENRRSEAASRQAVGYLDCVR